MVTQSQSVSQLLRIEQNQQEQLQQEQLRQESEQQPQELKQQSEQQQQELKQDLKQQQQELKQDLEQQLHQQNQQLQQQLQQELQQELQQQQLQVHKIQQIKQQLQQLQQLDEPSIISHSEPEPRSITNNKGKKQDSQQDHRQPLNLNQNNKSSISLTHNIIPVNFAPQPSDSYEFNEPPPNYDDVINEIHNQ